MTDPQTTPEKAPNQWLAQQEDLKEFHRLMQAGGMRISTLPPPLQPGSAVITILFSKDSEKAPEKDSEKAPEKTPNQWLAQQDSIARFHRSMAELGMQRSTLPPPLLPGSAVITIPFRSALSPQQPE